MIEVFARQFQIAIKDTESIIFKYLESRTLPIDEY